MMYRCKFCNLLEVPGAYFLRVKFATSREESCLVDYKGGYFCYGHLCPSCALRVNYITNQFPQELRTKR